MSAGDRTAGIGTRACILLAIALAFIAAMDPDGAQLNLMIAALALLLLGATLALMRIEKILRQRLPRPPTIKAPALLAMVSPPSTEEERDAMRAALAARGIRAP